MISRVEALKILARKVTDEVVVCAFGSVGNQWRLLPKGEGSLNSCGAMGLAAPIGLGVALAAPHKKVLVLDGDGALLMNLGCLATIARQNPPNLVHLVFENRVYASAGGQPIVNAGAVDFPGLARSAGIKDVYLIEKIGDFKAKVEYFLKARALIFAAIRVRADEPFPEEKDVDYVVEKLRFMEKIRLKA